MVVMTTETSKLHGYILLLTIDFKTITIGSLKNVKLSL